MVPIGLGLRAAVVSRGLHVRRFSEGLWGRPSAALFLDRIKGVDLFSATRTRRAALYVRVSTDRQTGENQVARLAEVAKARGWQIVATFTDAGISGAKGRKDRPGLDDMLKQAQHG
jgi:hypothetical protein